MPGEPKVADQKLGSSTEHAKKALDAATEATKAVGETVKKQAQVAIDAGREHLTAAAKDLGEAAAATYSDLREQALSKTQQYREKANAAFDDYGQRAQAYRSDAENYIRENPLQSVGIAVGVGFLLGLILRR